MTPSVLIFSTYHELKPAWLSAQEATCTCQISPGPVPQNQSSSRSAGFEVSDLRVRGGDLGDDGIVHRMLSGYWLWRIYYTICVVNGILFE